MVSSGRTSRFRSYANFLVSTARTAMRTYSRWVKVDQTNRRAELDSEIESISSLRQSSQPRLDRHEFYGRLTSLSCRDDQRIAGRRCDHPWTEEDASQSIMPMHPLLRTRPSSFVDTLRNRILGIGQVWRRYPSPLQNRGQTDLSVSYSSLKHPVCGDEQSLFSET